MLVNDLVYLSVLLIAHLSHIKDLNSMVSQLTTDQHEILVGTDFLPQGVLRNIGWWWSSKISKVT